MLYMMIYDFMSIYILLMHPNILFMYVMMNILTPFVVVMYYGVCTLGVQTLRTKSSSLRDV